MTVTTPVSRPTSPASSREKLQDLARFRMSRAVDRAAGRSAVLPPFTMAFQPIVDVQDRRIVTYEALVRGPGGEDAASVIDQVTPDKIPQFDQACRTTAIEMAARLGMDRDLSINFLPGAIYEPEACTRSTLQAAASARFPLDRLIFEILETQAISDTQHMLSIMREYRRHGLRLALDDFGNGYSGLLRLVELKPDIVKVDKVFTQGCDRDATRLAVIASIVRLGAEIGVKVVVEGAEKASEVSALRSAGVRFIQGYYFGKSIFENMIRDQDIAWPA